MEKKLIKIELDSHIDFEGELDSIISRLLAYKDMGDFEQIEIEKDYYWDSVIYNAYGYRHETDEEYDNRMIKESSNKEKQELKRQEKLKKILKEYPELTVKGE